MIENGFSEFLPYTREQLLVAKRQHKFVMYIPLAITLFLTFLFLAASWVMFITVIKSYELFLISCLTIVTLALNIGAKILIDWYLHAYMVTSRKILEVKYSPFASDVINEVLMDQVKCTEVDVHTHGILNQIIGLGDIVLTFDRPTHQQEFIFSSIQHYQDLGHVLSNMLVNTSTGLSVPVWFKSRDKSNKLQFRQEIFPQGGNPAV